MTRRTTTPTATHHEFVALVHTTLVWTLRATYRLSKHDAEDAASAAVLRLLPKVALVVASYPSAQTYAYAVAQSAAEDFARSQRAQRSEGARLVTDGTDPTVKRSKRTVVPLGATAERHASDLDLEHQVTTEIAAGSVLRGLGATDRWLVWAVATGEYTQTEAARVLGITREHACRTYHALIARLRAQHGRLAEAA